MATGRPVLYGLPPSPRWYPQSDKRIRPIFPNSGDIYEQAVVKTVAGFFRGNSTHLFGITRFGAPGIHIRAGSSHLNEVMRPQSPRTESGQAVPQIIAKDRETPAE